MARQPVSDALWNDFHDMVNMTSAELEEWLLLEASGPEGEAVPEQDEPELGHHVVQILGKRRTDLTGQDAQVMQTVVDQVQAEQTEESAAGDASWRHRLMRMGHDPLKPAG